jgi:Cu/Ag efflux pump CusA
LRGYANDVYFQVGLITIIGLSAKNAILIIEFAKDLQAQGKGVIESALAAAHLRFRPIIMTSMAFGLGVLPLAIASGAGSASQRAIGTGVLGGMLTGTGAGGVLRSHLLRRGARPVQGQRAPAQAARPRVRPRAAPGRDAGDQV